MVQFGQSVSGVSRQQASSNAQTSENASTNRSSGLKGILKAPKYGANAKKISSLHKLISSTATSYGLPRIDRAQTSGSYTKRIQFAETADIRYFTKDSDTDSHQSPSEPSENLALPSRSKSLVPDRSKSLVPNRRKSLVPNRRQSLARSESVVSSKKPNEVLVPSSSKETKTNTDPKQTGLKLESLYKDLKTLDSEDFNTKLDQYSTKNLTDILGNIESKEKEISDYNDAYREWEEAYDEYGGAYGGEQWAGPEPDKPNALGKENQLASIKSAINQLLDRR